MSKTGNNGAQPGGNLFPHSVPAGPQPYIPVKKQVNERSLARRLRYEQLLSASAAKRDDSVPKEE